MSAKLRLILALILVPVVLVTGPMSPASALVVTRGDAVPYVMEWCGRGPQQSGVGSVCVTGGANRKRCNFDAYWEFTESEVSDLRSLKVIVRNFYCRLGPLVPDVQWARVKVEGSDDAGFACGGSTAAWGDNSEGFQIDTTEPHGTTINVSGLGADLATCQIARVCVMTGDGDYDEAVFTTTTTYRWEHVWVCQQSGAGTIGGPDGPTETEDPTTCTYGQVGRPVSAQQRIHNGGTYSDWRRVVNYSVTGLVYAKWMPYAIVKPSPNRTTVYTNTQSAYTRAWFPQTTHSLIVPAWANYVPYGGTNGGFEVPSAMVVPYALDNVLSNRWQTAQGSAAVLPQDGEIVGFGIYRIDPAIAGQQSYTPQANPTNGLIGVTDEGRCSFYWGEDVAESPPGSTDTGPVGPVEPPTGGGGNDAPADPGPYQPGDQDDEGACDFDFKNPLTWPGGGICALVGLLGAALELLGDLIGAVGNVVAAIVNLAGSIVGPIVSAITGLLGAIGGIATAILEGLMNLLIPSPSSWKLNPLINQFKARPPFSVLLDVSDAATGFADGFSAGGSCGQLLNFGDLGSVSCADVKSKPGFNAGYALCTVALWAITGLACYRMVAANIGDRS